MAARILVVDDSGFARRTLRQMLETAGHTVDEAQDGVAALDQYSRKRPDLVLLDVVMEGIDGLEVLRKIRQLDPMARVLLATADIQTSTSSDAKAAGACGIATKPFQKDQVLSTVLKIIDGGTAWT